MPTIYDYPEDPDPSPNAVAWLTLGMAADRDQYSSIGDIATATLGHGISHQPIDTVPAFGDYLGARSSSGVGKQFPAEAFEFAEPTAYFNLALCSAVSFFAPGGTSAALNTVCTAARSYITARILPGRLSYELVARLVFPVSAARYATPSATIAINRSAWADRAGGAIAKPWWGDDFFAALEYATTLGVLADGIDGTLISSARVGECYGATAFDLSGMPAMKVASSKAWDFILGATSAASIMMKCTFPKAP